MSLLRNRDFMLLWSGQTVSEVGSSVTFVALPLLALYTLQASTFEVGALAACTDAAFLLVALPAGAWVDRWRYRRVLVWNDFGRLVVLGSVPLAHQLGFLTLGQLYVVALLGGIMTVFFDVAYQSYLPVLVDPADLNDANGKLGTSSSFAQVSGPGVGGALVGAVGAASAVLADTASFGLSTIATMAIRKPDREPPPREPGRRLRDDIKEGLHFVVRHPILRKIVACTGTANFFTNMGFAVLAVFLVRTLHESAYIVGLVFSVGGLAGIAAGLTAGRMGKRFGTARMIWLAPLVFGPGDLLTPFAFHGWGVTLIMAAGLCKSFGAVAYNVAQVTYRQTICPPHLLGRMNASVRFIVWGTQPLGALMGGILGTVIGVRETLLVAAVGGLTSALPVFFSPLRGMRDVPLD